MTNHLQISDEQALIVSTVKDGFNVSVNAVAGAATKNQPNQPFYFF